MKKRFLLIIALTLLIISIYAQFPPPAGQTGSTAIHKDSSVFVAWASQCVVERGPQQIGDSLSVAADAGEAWMATGKSGVNGTVSLGDAGYAILTFDYPIYNGAGWDFAIFENGFSNEFLELAFVEVSSDGINFYRFASTSLTQDTAQIGSFGTLDATKIDNLAGKYRANYGTPFDLEELNTLPLDLNNITHVKIIDVVGSISPLYAGYDQWGHVINDPFPTPFGSGGFDLDAVGVINSTNTSVEKLKNNYSIQLFPNPASTHVNVHFIGNSDKTAHISIKDLLGHTIYSQEKTLKNNDYIKVDTRFFKSNLYILTIESPDYKITEKILIIND